MEAFDFRVEIVGDRIHRDADRKIRGAAQSFSGPVGALIQAMQNFDEADGVDFVDSARFGIVADRRRIAGDREDVANAADGPRAEQHRLQSDDVVVARGEMRNRFDAARFERARSHQRVHADAGHRAAVHVDDIDFARRHDAIDLFVDAIERQTFRRIDFDADREFFFLQLLEKFAFGIALGDDRRLRRALRQ